MGEQQAENQRETMKGDIRKLVARLAKIPEIELEDDVLIRDELGIDSMRAIEIFYGCEKTFGMKLDETQFGDVQTVGEFISLLIEKWQEGRHG
ncbi:MAG: acyl carrier protein [Spirochaetia bacterium]